MSQFTSDIKNISENSEGYFISTFCIILGRFSNFQKFMWKKGLRMHLSSLEVFEIVRNIKIAVREAY